MEHASVDTATSGELKKTTPAFVSDAALGGEAAAFLHPD